MKQRWWRKKLSRAIGEPTIALPLKDIDGNTIGWIDIDSDGYFTGSVEMEKFYTRFSKPALFGMISGVRLTPILQPPTPPWKK